MYNDNEEFHKVTFTSYECSDGSTVNIERTLDDASNYSDVVQHFAYFLNSIGYSYIAGLAVLDDHGREIHRTSI
jgi:hypothetical protein